MHKDSIGFVFQSLLKLLICLIFMINHRDLPYIPSKKKRSKKPSKGRWTKLEVITPEVVTNRTNNLFTLS